MVERIGNKDAKRVRLRRRWVVAAIAAVFMILVLLYRFYNTVQTPHRFTLEKAEHAAVEQLNLQQVLSVERFVGDRPYSVLVAVDASGDGVLVWMWDEGHHIEKQDAGLTKEQVKEMTLAEHPAAQLLRISPGKLRDEYVWEVFYKITEESGRERHCYDYYRFSDGEKLDTYRLAN